MAKNNKTFPLSESNPELLSEWDYDNNAFTPQDVTAGSDRKMWWKCSKGHSWQSSIHNRVKGSGCPYCSGRKAIRGINDLSTTNPELANEWNYQKNKELTNGIGDDISTPDRIMANSSQKVWWVCKYGHEWEAEIGSRTKGSGCPFCSGKIAITGINDLATTNPELVKEWNYEKNKGLTNGIGYDISTPDRIMANSKQKVWWICKYGHEWKAVVYSRSNGTGCPICTNKGTSKPEQGIAYYLNKCCTIEQRIRINNNEIDVYLPEYNIGIEYDGSFYHTDHLKDNRKEKSIRDSGVALFRVIESDKNIINDNRIYYKYDDMGANYEWALKSLFSIIAKHTNNKKIGDISIDVKRDRLEIRERYSLTQKNKSLAAIYPEVAKEWNYEKNGLLKPDMFGYGSQERVWWKCSKGHEWESLISNRSKGYSCPYCAGQRAVKGENDLAVINPDLAKEWNYEKNGELMPYDVKAKSNKQVWWKCARGHEWKASVVSRYRNGCPYCSGRSVLRGVNDLATIVPQLSKEWNYEKNIGITPSDVSAKSGKKVWWKCPNGHEWSAVIASRVDAFYKHRKGCPICSNKQVLVGYNDLASVNPQLANEWDYSKNALTPQDVTSGSSKRVWWKCKKGHEWQTAIYNRTNGKGCPYCSGNLVITGETDLLTLNPRLAREWNYARNGALTPSEVKPQSNIRVWWKCSNGHEWRERINSRSRGLGCPYCSGRRYPQIMCIETGCIYNNVKEAAASTGANAANISKCCKGMCKSSGGYHWRYVDD